MITLEALKMSIQVKAIYENGVFRPLQSVQLAEQQEVTVTIDGHGVDSSDSGNQTLFALTPERWQSFCDALDAAPRENPALRKLLTEASLFDGNPSSPAKSGSA
jgi:predicted DNA-binding antitoxin AbrB/MazE fold protein